MSVIVSLIVLLTRFIYIESVRTCVPNSTFRLDGQQCHCDVTGSYTAKSCIPTSRRDEPTCEPGQIITKGCYECVCKIGGEFLCSNKKCHSQSISTASPTQPVAFDSSLSVIGGSCNPFQSYYVNCSICVCPSDGITKDAHCTPQGVCLPRVPPLSNFLATKRNVCLPKVLYVYPCLQCTCSDIGNLNLNKCVETCEDSENKTCIPKSYYKKHCKVCYCPKTGLRDDNLCVDADCKSKRSLMPLQALIEEKDKCEPHKFSSSRCVYCDCTTNGAINENSCAEMDCIKSLAEDDFASKEKCAPGNVVPFCVECFCVQSGFTNYKYCSRSCSLYTKLNILQTVIKDSFSNDGLINSNAIKKHKSDTSCIPNSIYLEDLKYCLCPKTGDTRYKICIAMKEVTKKHNNFTHINFNISCEPLTFIEFDCNSCFCNKDGVLDPKWCSYDDCEAKKTILQERKERLAKNKNNTSANFNFAKHMLCVPGSITKIGCNFCICPDNGQIKDKACTKNKCSPELEKEMNDKLTCEPLSYYEVDCNICYCPRNGIKNVAKCTKNICESYLRNTECKPGDLYSEYCNLCICPPTGKKKETVCTNRNCDGSDDHWSTIFRLSQSLTHPVTHEKSRVLDLCFPGEEFADGCKTCICPDMGLKAYAICVDNCLDNPCTQNITTYSGKEEYDDKDEDNQNLDDDSPEYFRQAEGRDKDCFKIDRRQITAYLYEKPISTVLRSAGNKTRKLKNRKKPEKTVTVPCSPGSQYILDCKQCICPLRGNIYNYCRPLPKETYCVEDSLRRQDDNSNSEPRVLSNKNLTHTHTVYKCKKPGNLMDTCYICECEGESNELIFEHCFISSSTDCAQSTPTFLRQNTKEDTGEKARN